MSQERLAIALADRYRIERQLGQGGMAIEGPHAGPRYDRGLYYFRARLTVEAISP